MKFNDTFFKGLLDNLYDGVYYVDPERTILYWNKGAERLTGYSSAEVLGTRCRDNILMHVDTEGTNLCTSGCPLQRSMQSGEPLESEVFLHHKNGHRVPVRVRAAPLRDSGGNVIGGVEIFSDNSEKINSLDIIEELQRKAFLDPLTGLANRRYLDTGLPARFDEIARYGWQFGVIMMDIDHFKSVNDRYGHYVGDEALKMVARTLLNSSRSSDIIGRWGGEEFVAILPNATALRLLMSAERHRALVERSSLPLESGPLTLTISAGATLVLPGDTPATLIKRADKLLYESKANGRNCVTSD
jgi:diguanylate cyclase (GGDEF)-like protein/PAS domain S-box-containing protein